MSKKYFMIGNAHLDPVWLWNWQEGFQETKATFRSALDRMKEYEDFIFTSSSAVNYEWVEKNDPEMFAEIKQRIQEGRWHIAGGWWTQPDCNIPSGESLARQGLYGQRYFKEKFGVTATVGYNVDSFGHNGMIPQILKKSGMDAYVMMRPMPNEKGFPNRLFWWESDDGSKVLTFRIMYEYLSWGKELQRYVTRCQDEFKGDVDALMLFYGVGNHGGGPTKENIESIHAMQRAQTDELPELKLGTPAEYFEYVREQGWTLPVLHDDLQHHASGCYAAESKIKHLNRKAENKLITAEKFAVMAEHITGQPYPKEALDQAWKNVLFNQFHDILAGTSLESAYIDAANEYGEAMAIADRTLNYALQSLSWKIQIQQDERMLPIVVFNPHAWESTVNVELEVGGLKDNAVLKDFSGNLIPFQRVQSEATAKGRFRISFLAKLPALGYKTYQLFLDSEEQPLIEFGVHASQYCLENRKFRLEIDPKTGWIKMLYDKEHDHQVFKGPAARPIVIQDKTDTWSHDQLVFNDQIGEFTAKKIYLAEDGPVKSVIRVISAYHHSELVQDFILYKELDYIDVNVRVNWQEQFKMLKLFFPINTMFRKNTYEIPYGTIMRENNGEEEPGQSWVDVTGLTPNQEGIYGLTLMNDAKYSYSIANHELALTVLRSPIYAHHDPLVPEEDGFYSFIDQGIQQFQYRLFPHERGWEESRVTQLAQELNVKPKTIIETYHDGSLPVEDAYLTCSSDQVMVSAVKKAEDDGDLIIRAYETTGRPAEVTIYLSAFNREFTQVFKPSEIKTFKIPRDSALPVLETNLLEWY